jgi:RimJ/RimL family protein N-acetyltransferase
MTTHRTARLVLHAIDLAEAERVVARSPDPTDVWAADFPFDGDVMGVGGFLRTTYAFGDQQPFGHYRITRLADGQAIGGIGFKGQPEEGCVEIGYGVVPSARGHGYAAEAITALLKVARDHGGVTKVIADTTLDNVASQRSLARAGFSLTRSDAALAHFEVTVT